MSLNSSQILLRKGSRDKLRSVGPRQTRVRRSQNPKIDLDLETICLKCLEKDPARRYASAAALAAELDAYLHGRPIAARPISWRERAWRWCRRNPLAAGLIGVSCASVLLLSFGLYYRGQVTSATKAVEAAEELTRTQQFYAAWNKARETRAQADPAWTWACWDDLQRALALRRPTDSAAELTDLRSLAMECLSSADARIVREVVPGLNVSCTAFSPDGTKLAVGQGKAGQSCAVHVVTLSQPDKYQTLSVSNLGSNFLRSEDSCS